MDQLYNPLNSNEQTWRESKAEATRPLGDTLAPVISSLMKTQPAKKYVEGDNDPLPPWSPPKREKTTHHRHVGDEGRRRNRHDHGVSMIVILHNCYLWKSINFMLHCKGFTIFYNKRIIHFWGTIQFFITSQHLVLRYWYTHKYKSYKL
jgi:hypothetical protein